MKAILILAFIAACQAFIMTGSMDASNDVIQCIISNCQGQAIKCQGDQQCLKAMTCVQRCGQQPACEAACAKGLDTNPAFTNLMNCEGDCFISNNVYGFACLNNQCKTQWQACKTSASCSAALNCADTCFGYESCQQDCAAKSTDQTLQDLVTCQVQYCF